MEKKTFQIADLWLSALMLIATFLPGVYMGTGYSVWMAAVVSMGGLNGGGVQGVLFSGAAWICCVVFIIMRVIELIRKQYHRRQFFFIARIVFALLFIYACYDLHQTLEGVLSPMVSLSHSIKSNGLNNITSMLTVKYGIGFWLMILLALGNIILLWKHPTDNQESEETEETLDGPVEAQTIADNVVEETQSEQLTERGRTQRRGRHSTMEALVQKQDLCSECRLCNRSARTVFRVLLSWN